MVQRGLAAVQVRAYPARHEIEETSSRITEEIGERSRREIAGRGKRDTRMADVRRTGRHQGKAHAAGREARATENARGAARMREGRAKRRRADDDVTERGYLGFPLVSRSFPLPSSSLAISSLPFF